MFPRTTWCYWRLLHQTPQLLSVLFLQRKMLQMRKNGCCFPLFSELLFIIRYIQKKKKTLILDFPCFHTCLLFKFILQPCKAIFFLLWLCFVHSQLMILDFFVAFFFFNFYCCILKVNITSKNTLVWLAFFCWVLASFQSPLKLTT